MDQFILENQYKEPTEKYNLVSIVLFRPKTTYKKFMYYLSGVEYLINNMHKYLPGFYLRFYYDDSVLNNPESNKDMEQLLVYAKTKDYVQIVKYRHPLFYKDGMHIGLFGTVVRMLPLFDTSNTNIVVIAEADMGDDVLLKRYQKMYETLDSSKYSVYMATKQCYYGRCRYKNAAHELGINHLPYAGLFVTKMKFPQYLLDDFLNCTLQNEFNNKTCGYVNKFYHDIKKCMGKKNIPEYGVYTYGLDEVFDAYLLKYLVQNKIPYIIDIAPDLFFPLEAIFENDLSRIEEPIYKELLMKLMGKFYNQQKTVLDNFNYLHSIVSVFLENREKNYRYKYVAKRVFFTYLDLLKSGEYKKYGLDEDFLMCVKHHYNIIEIATVLCTGTTCINYVPAKV